MKNYKILFKFPIRSRRDKLFSTLNKYYSLMSDKTNYSFLINIDRDDKELNNPETIARVLEYDNLDLITADCHSKIEAVNYGIADQDWDIVVIVSDDMIPQVEGYDNIIRVKMDELYPDLDGCLWFNDGFQKDNVNTLQICGRKWFDRWGYIYHSDYLSLYSDTEYQEVAKRLKKITYIDQVIIRHEHPNYHLAPMDAQYRLNNVNEKHDSEAFNRRKLLKFPVGIPKIAHFIWSKGTPLSYFRWLSYDTFRRLHPDWRIMFHLVSGCKMDKTWIGTEELEFQTKANKRDYLANVDPECIVKESVDGILPNYASDLIRWESLYKYGGYYFDLDQLFIKSFNSLLDYDIVWGGTRISYSGVIGMFERCPVAKQMADAVSTKLSEGATEYCEVGNWLWLSFVSSQSGQTLLSGYKTYQTPMPFFYPIEESWMMKEHYEGKRPNLLDSYALHWFGGHPDSQAFNRQSVSEINKTLAIWQG